MNLQQAKKYIGEIKLSDKEKFESEIEEIFENKRAEKGLTKSQFAKWLGVKTSVIKKIEAGLWRELK